MRDRRLTNVVLAGLGGQGVLTASEVLAKAALYAGYEVKKSEIKGMSQRGGSVTSDVRFGDAVFSPMVSPGEADYLVVLEATQVEPHRFWLRPGGTLITPEAVADDALPNRKSLNAALLGVLSNCLPIAEEHWAAALRASFPERSREPNRLAFQTGRQAAITPSAL